MCPETTTQKNSAASIVPLVRPRMPWRVEQVHALEGYRLKVRFIDGLEGEVHMATLVHSPNAGVFAALRNPSVFEQVFIQYGAVTWGGELDLAPDAMHERIRANGIWIPA
jgi:hypothetical protein